MKIPVLKRGQAVIVDWNDAKSLLGWTYNEKMQRKPGKITSLGIVVQKNREVLTITNSMDYRGASLDDLSIPVGCITGVQLLKQEDLRPKEASECKSRN